VDSKRSAARMIPPPCTRIPSAIVIQADFGLGRFSRRKCKTFAVSECSIAFSTAHFLSIFKLSHYRACPELAEGGLIHLRFTPAFRTGDPFGTTPDKQLCLTATLKFVIAKPIWPLDGKNPERLRERRSQRFGLNRQLSRCSGGTNALPARLLHRRVQRRNQLQEGFRIHRLLHGFFAAE
jgi:hypothetical protein